MAGVDLQDRFRGCLVGLAFGDALGAPYEFKAPPFEVVAEFRPGVFGTGPGQPTDDTELALQLAHSIDEWGEFVPGDYAAKLLDWAQSSPPDIGAQTAAAAKHYAQHGTGPPDTPSAGNGSLMAIAPLALLMAFDPLQRGEAATRFANITHPNGDVRLINARFCDAIATALAGGTVPIYPRPAVDPAGSSMGWCRLTCALATEALESTDSADDAVASLIEIIALGGDTDTNAAVAGALLGSRWGTDCWPADLVNQLATAHEMTRLADRIYQLTMS